MIAKPGKDSGYAKIVTSVDQERCLVVRGEYYESGDEPAKLLTPQVNAEEESIVDVVSESPKQIPEPLPNESMPVWVSFHSQMSAEGFARQLSDQFHHPFAVARQGPGDYQVVFDYGSIDERDALLDEIAAVTGYRAP